MKGVVTRVVDTWQLS